MAYKNLIGNILMTSIVALTSILASEALATKRTIDEESDDNLKKKIQRVFEGRDEKDTDSDSATVSDSEEDFPSFIPPTHPLLRSLQPYQAEIPAPDIFMYKPVIIINNNPQSLVRKIDLRMLQENSTVQYDHQDKKITLSVYDPTHNDEIFLGFDLFNMLPKHDRALVDELCNEIQTSGTLYSEKRGHVFLTNLSKTLINQNASEFPDKLRQLIQNSINAYHSKDKNQIKAEYREKLLGWLNRRTKTIKSSLTLESPILQHLSGDFRLEFIDNSLKIVGTNNKVIPQKLHIQNAKPSSLTLGKKQIILQKVESDNKSKQKKKVFSTPNFRDSSELNRDLKKLLPVGDYKLVNDLCKTMQASGIGKFDKRINTILQKLSTLLIKQGKSELSDTLRNNIREATDAYDTKDQKKIEQAFHSKLQREISRRMKDLPDSSSRVIQKQKQQNFENAGNVSKCVLKPVGPSQLLRMQQQLMQTQSTQQQPLLQKEVHIDYPKAMNASPEQIRTLETQEEELAIEALMNLFGKEG